MRKLSFVIIFVSFLFANGEVHKGQTYYYYLLKDHLGYDGSVFAKKHTDKQWLKLFDNNAQGLKKYLLSQNESLHAFLQSKKFNKISPHLKAFVIQFASNKKNIPQCRE